MDREVDWSLRFSKDGIEMRIIRVLSNIRRRSRVMDFDFGVVRRGLGRH